MANLEITPNIDVKSHNPDTQASEQGTDQGGVQHELAPSGETEPHLQPGRQQDFARASREARLGTLPLVRADSTPPDAEIHDPFKPGGSTPPNAKIDDPSNHLLQHEKEILKRQLDLPAIKVNYTTLFRYATKNDRIILTIAVLTAIISGALLPLLTVLFGGLAGTFREFTIGTISSSRFRSELARYSLYFVYLGIGEFVTVYIATVGFLYVGEHISAKIREHFLAAILRQNIAFFDDLGAGEITTRITADTNLVQEGISEKVGVTVSAIATFVSAFVIGFVRYWKLTLILSSTVVAIVVTLGAVGSVVAKLSKTYIAYFAEGGTVAEEVISSIRNATAFHTQEKLARRYNTYLMKAKTAGFKLKSTTSLMIAFLFL